MRSMMLIVYNNCKMHSDFIIIKMKTIASLNHSTIASVEVLCSSVLNMENNCTMSSDNGTLK